MRRLRAISILALLIVLSGCGDDPKDNNGSGQQDAVPAEEVRVLDQDARNSVNDFQFDVESNSGEVRIDASSAFADQIAEGRILASEPIDGTAPSGMLQRVTDVREEGGDVVATTRQATLAESFKRADFEMSRDIEASEMRSVQTYHEGVTVQTLEPSQATAKQGLENQFELNFERVLLDTDGDKSTTNDQVKLDGRVAFGAALDTAVKIKNFKMQRFLFAVELEESVDLEMIGDFDDADIEKSVKLAETNIDLIQFQIGPVPVVIKIDLIVTLGVDGTLTAEIQASAQQSASSRLGAEYTDQDGWSGINDSSSSFQVPPPQFSFDRVDARAYVRPQLEIKLYGVAGPFVFAEPYVRFAAEVYTSPFWELYGGLNVGAGLIVRVPVVGEVGSFEGDFNAFEEQIEESSNRAPELEIVSPSDGATTTPGGNLSVTVRASDRESEDVDIQITGNGVDASGLSTGGAETDIGLEDLCEGVYDLNVTATDAEGASTTKPLTIVVENATPTVTIDTSTLTDSGAPPIFPGSYVSASATVQDERCTSNESINRDLTEWYIDGERVSRSVDLLTRLVATEYSVGQTITVQARFDDGVDVGTSQEVDVALQQVPAGDLPAEANITQCTVCGLSISAGGRYFGTKDVTLSGVGYDPKEGELSGSRLRWELVPTGPANTQQVGTGNSVTFNLSDYYPDQQALIGEQVTVRLIVEDGAQTVTDTGTFDVFLGG